MAGFSAHLVTKNRVVAITHSDTLSKPVVDNALVVEPGPTKSAFLSVVPMSRSKSLVVKVGYSFYGLRCENTFVRFFPFVKINYLFVFIGVVNHSNFKLALFPYAERPLTPKELRAEYLEYNGEKFTSDFPKPAGGQSFTEFLIEIIEEAGLQIKYDDEECTFSFKKKRLPKIEKSSKVEESSKPRSSRSKKEVNESSESEREEEVKKPVRKQRNSRNQKSESSDVNAAGSASMLKTAMSKANQDSKKVGEEGFPNNGSSFVGNALENSSKKREDDETKNENNEEAAENDTESVKKEPETVKKPLPENLKTFYQNIGKAMQSIDTTSIDAISKKFGRKKSLKFAKYGYSSALELLVSIEGFYSAGK